MTSLDEEIEEFRAIGQELKKAVEAFTKRNKVDKNEAYKARRLTEATDIWNRFYKRSSSIQRQLVTPDDCFENEYEELEKIYKEYVKKLNKIGQSRRYGHRRKSNSDKTKNSIQSV